MTSKLTPDEFLARQRNRIGREYSTAHDLLDSCGIPKAAGRDDEGRTVLLSLPERIALLADAGANREMIA